MSFCFLLFSSRFSSFLSSVDAFHSAVAFVVCALTSRLLLRSPDEHLLTTKCLFDVASAFSVSRALRRCCCCRDSCRHRADLKRTRAENHVEAPFYIEEIRAHTHTHSEAKPRQRNKENVRSCRSDVTEKIYVTFIFTWPAYSLNSSSADIPAAATTHAFAEGKRSGKQINTAVAKKASSNKTECSKLFTMDSLAFRRGTFVLCVRLFVLRAVRRMLVSPARNVNNGGSKFVMNIETAVRRDFDTLSVGSSIWTKVSGINFSFERRPNCVCEPRAAHLRPRPIRTMLVLALRNMW